MEREVDREEIILREQKRRERAKKYLPIIIPIPVSAVLTLLIEWLIHSLQ